MTRIPLGLLLPAALTAQAPATVSDGVPARVHPLPTLREQADEQQTWLERRVERILPARLTGNEILANSLAQMRSEGIDGIRRRTRLHLVR